MFQTAIPCLIIAFTPWNTCGAFLMGVLGVSPFIYLPFAIFNWINPLIEILFGYLDYKIAYIDEAVENA